MRGQSSINSQGVNICSKNANNFINPGNCEPLAKSRNLRTICKIGKFVNNLLNWGICEQFAKLGNLRTIC